MRNQSTEHRPRHGPDHLDRQIPAGHQAISAGDNHRTTPAERDGTRKEATGSGVDDVGFREFEVPADPWLKPMFRMSRPRPNRVPHTTILRRQKDRVEQEAERRINGIGKS